jgi:hypothetical protein
MKGQRNNLQHCRAARAEPAVLPTPQQASWRVCGHDGLYELREDGCRPREWVVPALFPSVRSTQWYPNASRHVAKNFVSSRLLRDSFGRIAFRYRPGKA